LCVLSASAANVVALAMTLYPDGFECQQCGACCQAYVQVTERDLLRWAAEFRDDIVEWISPEDGFIHPVEEIEGPRCPFLKRLPQPRAQRVVYVCLIHETKPDACVRFPASKQQAERIGCLGVGHIES
jgi:Fe-S-cluster containining protein